MSDERPFLSRWSRRKLAATRPAEKREDKPPAKPAELPPPDSLTFDSDFAAYLTANLEEGVKRAALKKLLHDPRFNVMDGLDTYIDDYTKHEPIPEEMLKRLKHVRSTFQGLEQPKGEETSETAQRDAPAGQDDKDTSSGDPRQDT
jgi:hypothetical protein